VQLAIIGCKYDALSTLESYIHLYRERRRLLCKTLRYIAHINGAALLFVSQKDESTLTKAKQLLGNYAFKAGGFKTLVFDHLKALAVLPGQDAISQINTSTTSDTAPLLTKQPHTNYEKWRMEYTRVFPKSQGILG
jgi:dynein light intermediate chain 2